MCFFLMVCLVNINDINDDNATIMKWKNEKDYDKI